MRKSIYTVITFFTCLSLSADDVIKYQVQKGDTLSGILFKLDIGPIYGKHGFQKLAAKKNRLPYDGDKIIPGDVLVFPMSSVNRNIAYDDAISITADEIVSPRSEVDDQPHSLLISAQISQFNFRSESADAFQHNDIRAYSKPSPTLHLQYAMNWNENFKFTLFSSLSRVSFYDDDVFLYKKPSISKNSYGFGFGFKNKASELNARIGYFDEVFFSMPSTTVIQTDILSMPELHLSYRHKIKEFKKMSVKLGANGQAIFPNKSPRTEGHFGYGLGTELLVGSNSRNLRLFYNFSQANAKDQQTDTTEVGIGYVWESNFYEK